MTTIADVRQSLADAVATVVPMATAYLQDVQHVPSAQIMRKQMTPSMVFGDTKQVYLFGVLVYANRTIEANGQEWLDQVCEMTGASSLKAAIEQSSNWAATVDYAKVTNVGQTQLVQFDSGAQYLMVEFDVEVVW
jgi:hypothetical protein